MTCQETLCELLDVLRELEEEEVGDEVGRGCWKPRTNPGLLRTLVCLLTCSILHNNNLVGAGSLPNQKETMAEVVECV